MRAVLAAALLAASGCVTVEQSGESPSEIKQRLVASPTFQSLSDFYPQGMPSNDGVIYPRIKSATRTRLQARLQTYADGLAKLDTSKYGTVAKLFPQRKGSIKTFRVVVLDGQANRVRSSEETLEIDVMVVQAIFRGALIHAVEGGQRSAFSKLPELNRPSGQSYDPFRQTTEEYQALAKLLEMKRSVESMSAPGTFGTLLRLMRDDGDDSWFTLVEYDRAFRPLEVSYTGALLFLMAREQGHQVLDHATKVKQLNARVEHSLRTAGSLYCRSRQEFELEADVYALMLLNPSTEGIPSWVTEDLGGSSRAGYRSLILNGFPIAPVSPVEDECEATPNVARIKRLDVLDRAVKQEVDEHFNQRLSDALSSVLGQ